jgi:hypothetical protein
MRQNLSCFALLLCGSLTQLALAQVSVSPPAVSLTSAEASQQLLVTGKATDRQVDLTRTAKYLVSAPDIVTVDANGLVQPKAEGTTTLTITTPSGELKVPVTVTGLLQPKPVSFELEVQPILTKARCNSGGCHGKAEGQNGFKLSLLGFDALADHAAIVKEGRGRRISLASPQTSLLLRKAAAETPHGGGLKIDAGSPQYRRLLRWIASGAPAEAPDQSPVVGIEVEPAEVILQPKESQQLRVTATNAAGQKHCATVETEFISNMGMIVEATPRGLLQAGELPGEAAILVRYGGHVTVCRVVVPRPAMQIARHRNITSSTNWSGTNCLSSAFLRAISSMTLPSCGGRIWTRSARYRLPLRREHFSRIPPPTSEQSSLTRCSIGPSMPTTGR